MKIIAKDKDLFVVGNNCRLFVEGPILYMETIQTRWIIYNGEDAQKLLTELQVFLAGREQVFSISKFLDRNARAVLVGSKL